MRKKLNFCPIRKEVCLYIFQIGRENLGLKLIVEQLEDIMNKVRFVYCHLYNMLKVIQNPNKNTILFFL